MQSVVILGTGGTIAGSAASGTDNVGYVAGSIGIERLVAAVPALAAERIECEQVVRLDSKDMDTATWARLAARCAFHLGRDEVAGIVVTHGTDTLEETALFLHRVLAPARPIVLTGAMRPATSLAYDGAQNLLDAVRVAREPGARGVVVAFAQRVLGALDVRKVHPYRIDAFDAGDAGPIALLEEGVLRRLRDWPASRADAALDRIAADPAAWPRVEIVTSHAGADGGIVRALLACDTPPAGIVVAGTGNGTMHRLLEAALAEATTRGVRVLRATRCAAGSVIGDGDERWPSAGALTPAKARVALLLDLMGVPP